MAENEKEWTGERLETFIFTENTSEHLHRYALACEWAGGKRVLDIACGEGYGSNLLSYNATEVVGVDISETVIEDAKVKYRKDNLTFLAGSADRIPLADQSFDLVVSFETIEHHDRHQEMMQEIKRVLKPNGILIMSSPDKRFYSDLPGYKNPFHVKELYKDQFELLVGNYFREFRFLSQKYVTGSLVLPVGNGGRESDSFTFYSGDYTALGEKEFGALYLIGVASDYPLPELKISFFDGDAVLKRQFRLMEEYYNHQISVLQHAYNSRIDQKIIRMLRKIKRLINA